jgi:peptidoglycan/LPS O-acetylase OafA/YrhL
MTFPSIKKNRPEIDSLTGIRAFASWWVVLYHLHGSIAKLIPGSERVLWIAHHGDMGVDLFFVLSGFVLAYNYHDAFPQVTGTSYFRFLWLRLARIYPVHCAGLAVWGMFLIANLVLKHSEVSQQFFGARALLAQLLLVQSWSVPMVMSWNYPAWSISMEWLAYLAFPFLIRFVAKSTSVAAPLFGLAVLGLGAPLLMTTPAGHFVRIGTEFTAGCLLYLLYSRGCGVRLPWGWISSLVFLFVVVAATQLGGWILPFLIILVYSLTFNRGPAATICGSRPCVYLGRISYSVYIMHAAAITACHVLLPLARFQESSFFVRSSVIEAYILTIALSGVLAYHLVEEPCRRRMRKWFRPSGTSLTTQPESSLVAQ